jgi:periodic tryptophan protein 1
VGSISPGIEIWDLDVVNAVEPLITLGGELLAAAAATADAGAEAEGSKKKKKKKVCSLPAMLLGLDCAVAAGQLLVGLLI